jgi:hypothetical protein
MRYMLRFEASIEAGDKVDTSSGAAAGIGTILELLKPEAFWVSIFKRELFMVVNTDDTALLSEAAHVVLLVAGTNMEVTPIMTGEEAMGVLPAAIQRAVETAKKISG